MRPNDLYDCYPIDRATVELQATATGPVGVALSEDLVTVAGSRITDVLTDAPMEIGYKCFQ